MERVCCGQFLCRCGYLCAVPSRKSLHGAVFIALLAVLAALVPLTMTVVARAPVAAAQAMSADEINEDLGVGINLGTALERPREGAGGLTLRESYFTEIADVGFGHVRVPIRFNAYASETAPYEIPDGIDPTVPNADNLWDRIDWVIENAERNDLYVILDAHMYDELSFDVAGERARFLSIWSQVADRYSGASERVLFELLNEPQGQFNDNPSMLNTLIADAVSVIRSSNPTRPVLVGPAYWNQIGALDVLELPDDPNLIVSVHFYDPFDFTHQGATWIDPVPPAPASFEPDLIGFGAGWQDWSWGATAVTNSTSLQVRFQGQWSGLAFGGPGSVAPASLQFTVAGASELAVRCSVGDDDNLEIQRVVTTESAKTFDVDMSNCPATTRSINFMLVSQDVGPLDFYEIALCDTDGQCRQLIESGEEAIASAFAQAAAWGSANNRPINVGEFGVYGADGVADMDDRAMWTEMVTRAGQTHGFSMTYWEFGAGFGAYDVATNTWVEPLVAALLTKSTAVDGSLSMVVGDANCDSTLDIGDALAIAQFTVGSRRPVDDCSLELLSTEINERGADFDGDGIVDIGDALKILQCAVGVGPEAQC